MYVYSTHVLFEFLSLTDMILIISFRMLQVNVGALTYPEYEVNVSQPLFATMDSFQRQVNRRYIM